jgi:hypothetical protein
MTNFQFIETSFIGKDSHIVIHLSPEQNLLLHFLYQQWFQLGFLNNRDRWVT